MHGLLHGLRLHEPVHLIGLAAIEEAHASSKEKVEQRDDASNNACEKHVARVEHARSIDKSSSRTGGCAGEVDQRLAGQKSAESDERAGRKERTVRAETRAVRACSR